MDTYVYKIGSNLYINLTNKCPNSCSFCVRNLGKGVNGYSLWLEREPAAAEVIELIGTETRKPAPFDWVVFCGYGEPCFRLDAIKEIAAFARTLGKKTRLDTNGLGGAINGRDITGDLTGLIDIVSVSLNAASPQAYQKLCFSAYGESAFGMVLDFAKRCVTAGIETVLSVVDIIGCEEIEKCRVIAQQTGAALRVRELITPETL